MDMVLFTFSMRKTQKSVGQRFEKQSVVLCEHFWLQDLAGLRDFKVMNP